MTTLSATIQHNGQPHQVSAAPAQMEGELSQLLKIAINGQPGGVVLAHEPYDGSFYCRQLNKRFADFMSAAHQILVWLLPEPTPRSNPDGQKTTWTAESIAGLIERDDRAVQRAIVAIYNRQDECQKMGQSSGKSSGRGFSRYDRAAGNSLAHSLANGRGWTAEQMAKARRLALKYKRQLVEIATSKGGA